MYLRIVHSIDYYNGSDYPHEDEMPNRCGILHVRGEKPEKANYSEGMIALYMCFQYMFYQDKSCFPEPSDI